MPLQFIEWHKRRNTHCFSQSVNIFVCYYCSQICLEACLPIFQIEADSPNHSLLSMVSSYVFLSLCCFWDSVENFPNNTNQRAQFFNYQKVCFSSVNKEDILTRYLSVEKKLLPYLFPNQTPEGFPTNSTPDGFPKKISSCRFHTDLRCVGIPGSSGACF